ncbi:hypothetical protein OAJ56_00145 [Flavobacteriales bacterium]|nr:hypothetical protein [Flavobacteriales bacterium]
MKFKDIIGNNELKKQLINSVENNRLSHSQLFLGPAGGPKLTVAIAFAQYINCTNKVNSDSCGECHSCVKYNLLTHPDLHLVFPVLSINGIKKAVSDNFVKEWRQEIIHNPYLNLHNWFDIFSSENKTGKTGYIYTQESDNLHQKLSLKHYESEYRVVIIWIPEKMQAVTSNKLLKLLEEPPKKTIFLLVSENSGLLLNTILSRLQILKIKNYSSKEKTEILQNKFPEKEVVELEKSLIYSDGNLGDAIHILESDIITDDNFDDFQMWMRLCYSVNIQEIAKWVNERTKKGRRNQSIFLKYSLKMVRNCLIIHFSDRNTLNITENEKKFLSKFHPFIHKENISEISEKIEECIKNIERNANSKIMFYELSLQLMRLLKVKRKFVELN